MDNGGINRRNCEGVWKMKDVIKFILFLSYTICLFFITDYCILAILAGLQIVLMLWAKISLNQALHNVVVLTPFILFTVVINLLVTSLEQSILIGVRLAIVCNMTYLFSKTMTNLQLAEVIQKLLFPLKWIKIDPQAIGLVICIAIAFIPIIQNELRNIQYSLRAKGIDTRWRYLILHLSVILSPMLVSLFRKINEIEYALIAKAYAD